MTSQTDRKDLTATGQRLLEAAIDVFGRHGYDAATTRMIAREAGVNIAAIPYYYNGKEGLYRAAVSHVVELIASRLAGTLRDIADRSFAGLAEREDATLLLEELMSKMIMFMVGSPEAPRVARIILREQMSPSPAYDLIYAGLLASVLEAMASLIMVISGETSARRAKLRAMAVFGQILAFRVARETIVRALDLTGYSPDETEEIRRIIMEHTMSMLQGLVRSGNRPAGERL